MKRNRLLFRNLTYYRRTNLPIIIGVAIAVAVLSGALMVGQSVRASLRRLLYERIGSTEYLVSAELFFSEELGRAFAPQIDHCPIIYIKGVVIHERTGIRSHDVNVYGVDERFWKFHGVTPPVFQEERAAFVGDPLARQLNIQIDDALLLRVETQQTIPREWLYGRRDNIRRTLRLTCRNILPGNKLGEFALRPSQASIHSVFVPLAYLQKTLLQPSKINAILLARRIPGNGLEFMANALKQTCTLQDLGLRLRTLSTAKGFSLESSQIIIDDSTAQAAFHAASSLGIDVSPVYTYLANSIRAKGREIPYSVITAADFGVSIESSQERLAAYHQVENAYLSTFQSLGTLGLILGTVGLATVLLRNVLERRQELALLRAVGYRMRVLSAIILAENVFLMIWGLVSGTICALLAILPALHARGASLPLAMAAYHI